MPTRSGGIPSLLTVPEVAEIFRVTPSAIYKWHSAGVLKSVKVGGAVRFESAEVERRIAERAS